MHPEGAFLLMGRTSRCWLVKGISFVSARRVSILIAAFLIGVLVSVQWPSDADQQQDTPDQVMQTVRQLELEQAELKRTVGLLREELDARQQEMGSSTKLLEGLNSELMKCSICQP